MITQVDISGILTAVITPRRICTEVKGIRRGSNLTTSMQRITRGNLFYDIELQIYPGVLQPKMAIASRMAWLSVAGVIRKV
jgi:hypothetical protein